MIRLNPTIEAHAAQRLNERYGLAFTRELKAELFARIADARANDNRHPQACLIRPYGHRERWLVSIGGHVLHAVVNPSISAVVTFLPVANGTNDPF